MTTDPTSETHPDSTTAYEIRIDRDACEGIFACLVRDDRFEEASDGLATIAGADGESTGSVLTATFEDDRIEAARQAARACPVDAIEVTAPVDGAEGTDE